MSCYSNEQAGNIERARQAALQDQIRRMSDEELRRLADRIEELNTPTTTEQEQ